MLGGASASKPCGPEDLVFFTSLKAAVEKEAGKTFATYEPVEMKTQVVAGTNYFVKINVGGANAVHARIFKPLPNAADATPTVHSVKEVSGTEALNYF